MRFLQTIAVAAFLLGIIETAAAQQLPKELPLLRQFTRQGNQGPLWFKVVEGRVALDSRLSGTYQSRNRTLGTSKETISVTGGENGRPKLAYERTSATDQFKVDLGGAGDEMTLAYAPRGKESFVAVEFCQTADKGVSLTLGAGDDRRTFRAADLWRLLVSHPKECRQHLIPLLDLLRPDWKLAEKADEIESRLLALAGKDGGADRERWAPAVEQLGDDSFARREAADRALRSGGASALAYLRQLDSKNLDAEQQFRVRRIIDALDGGNEDDSADSVAALLSRDPAVWLALLERPEAAKRQVAARQLAVLLDGPIDVDAAAEPDSQKAKREALRARIER